MERVNYPYSYPLFHIVLSEEGVRIHGIFIIEPFSKPSNTTV